MTGRFYRGMWIVNERKYGEYISKPLAIEKQGFLQNLGYISIIKPVAFGTRTKFIVTAWKRGEA